MAATTVLAVAVMLSSAGVLIGLAALAVLGILLWLVRGYVPDVTAGLQLRSHQVREGARETFDPLSAKLRRERSQGVGHVARQGQFASEWP